MKMRMRGRTALLGMILLAAAGCASGGGGGTGTSDLMRESFGRVLGGTLETAREVIWQKHNILVERSELDPTQIFVQSIWLMRAAEPAEQALGATEARNQVTIRGRQLERTMDFMESVYRVDFEVRNEIRTAEGQWVPAPMPPEATAFFRRVYNDMRLELNTGVRR